MHQQQQKYFISQERKKEIFQKLIYVMGLLETLKASSSDSEKIYFKTAFDHPGVGFCAQNGYEVNPVSFDTIQRVYKNYQKKIKNTKTKKNRENNKKNKIQLGKKVSNLVEANIARKNKIGEKRKILKSLEEKRQGIGHPRVYNIGASEMKRREDEVVYLKKLLTENPARQDLVKRYEDSLGVLQRSRENQTFQNIPTSIHKLRNSITRSLYRVSAAQKEIDEQKKKSGRMEKRGGPSREERQIRRGKAPDRKVRKELDLVKKK